MTDQQTDQPPGPPPEVGYEDMKPTGDFINWDEWSETPPGADEEISEPTPENLNAGLAKMLEGTRPDVPVIEEPPSGHCTLLLGIEHQGVRYRSAVVRELNGTDEEAIARLPRNSANYSVLIVDLHLRRAVTQIGPVDVTKNPEVLGDLIVSDRDILFKEILLATYGTERDYERVVCPTCQFEMSLNVDIEGLIEITNPKSAFTSDRFVVELRDKRKVLMRYVTGKDQLAVFESVSRTPSSAEANTAFIAHCLVKVDNEIVADPEEWSRQLGIVDRRKIVDALLDVPAIGFKEVEVPCNKCGENLPTAFGWADLLPN